MLDDARSALLDVLHNELTKLRSLSASPELLGEPERKCLETYARIVKLLEKQAAVEEPAKSWSPEDIERTLGGGQAGLPVVREGPIGRSPLSGGAGGRDDEADEVVSSV